MVLNSRNIFFFRNIFISMLFVTGEFQCSTNHSICYQKFVNNHKFSLYAGISKAKENYLLFTDSVQLEYVNGKHKWTSNIVWTSCSNYLLIMRDSSNEILQIGDTLNVNITKKYKDTLSFVISGKGVSFNGRLIKID